MSALLIFIFFVRVTNLFFLSLCRLREFESSYHLQMASQEEALAKSLRSLGGLNAVNRKRARATSASEGNNSAGNGPSNDHPVVERAPEAADAKKKKAGGDGAREVVAEHPVQAPKAPLPPRFGPSTAGWVPHYEEALLKVASTEDYAQNRSMGYEDLAQDLIGSWGKVYHWSCFLSILTKMYLYPYLLSYPLFPGFQMSAELAGFLHVTAAERKNASREFEKELEEYKRMKDSEMASLARASQEALQREKAVGDALRAQVQELQGELSHRRPEEEVLSSFRSSQEYVDEVGAKSAAMIQKTYLVAEDFFLENQNGEWDDFIERFLARQQEEKDEEAAAEEALARAEEEAVLQDPKTVIQLPNSEA